MLCVDRADICSYSAPEKYTKSPQPRFLWENIPSAAFSSFLCLDCRNLKGKPGPRSLLSYSFHLYSAGNCENTSESSKKFWSLRTLKIQGPEIREDDPVILHPAQEHTHQWLIFRAAILIFFTYKKEKTHKLKHTNSTHRPINHGVFVCDRYQPSQSLIVPKEILKN